MHFGDKQALISRKLLEEDVRKRSTWDCQVGTIYLQEDQYAVLISGESFNGFESVHALKVGMRRIY